MQFYQPNEYRHVTYAWDDAYASKLDPVERLVYRSNILGNDQRTTNTGGGNTSSKIMMTDPLTGQQVDRGFAQLDGQAAVADDEQFVLILVLVPAGLADALGQLDQLPVGFADDALRPVLVDPGQFVQQIDLVHDGFPPHFMPAVLRAAGTNSALAALNPKETGLPALYSRPITR